MSPVSGLAPYQSASRSGARSLSNDNDRHGHLTSRDGIYMSSGDTPEVIDAVWGRFPAVTLHFLRVGLESVRTVVLRLGYYPAASVWYIIQLPLTTLRHCIGHNIMRLPLTPSFESMPSSGHRCPNVFANLMPVLRHSACCCHRTKRICDVFLPSLSWLSSASFPGYHSLYYCLL